MPQIVPFLIVVGKTIVADTLLGAVSRIALMTAVQFGLSKMNKPKTPQAAPDQGLELVKRIRTDHPIEVVVGETATPGNLMWWGVRGTDNE